MQYKRVSLYLTAPPFTRKWSEEDGNKQHKSQKMGRNGGHARLVPFDVSPPLPPFALARPVTVAWFGLLLSICALLYQYNVDVMLYSYNIVLNLIFDTCL
jgi:hypothetical protein